MTKPEITPEQLIEALKTAKESGQLKPEHILALEEFMTEVRSTISYALATEHVHGTVAVDGRVDLIFCRHMYDLLPDKIRKRASWQSIAEKLLANNCEKLKKVQKMQGGGEFVGIDKSGRALFKDKGTEPVMYGFDAEGRMREIYNRDPEQMEKIEKWADYNEIREQVLGEGYELFNDCGDFRFSDEMNQVASYTGKHFIASNKEYLASWLESGDKPVFAKHVNFHPSGDNIYVSEFSSKHRAANHGVIRLIRV